MRKIYFLPVFLLLSIIMNAQDWFPVNASWYYNQLILFSGNTYQHLTVTKDTIFQGKNCKVIKGGCQCGFYGVENFLYEDEDRIYRFSPQVDSFTLLYDFTLLPGDTFVYKGIEENGGDGYFLIDSISILTVGAIDLRVQHLSWLDGFIHYGTQIIERIGSNACLYPQSGVCDPQTGNIRCYEDEEVGLINFQIPEIPCDFVSSVDDPEDHKTLKVFPNPTHGNLHIESDQGIKQIELFNTLSIPCYRSNGSIITSTEINVEELPAGIYVLKVTMRDSSTLLKTIVILK